MLQHATGSTTCYPACLLISYSLSVGCGSILSSKIGSELSSYFVENYKSKWQAENAGRFFVERGVLKQVPRIVVTEKLPEGLAFISSCKISFKSNVYNLMMRLVIINSITYMIGYLVKKTTKLILHLTKLKTKTKVSKYEISSELEDGIDTYYKIVGEDV